MELAKDAFYVVRKGDIVGVYKSFGDCQAQLSSSIILHFSISGLNGFNVLELHFTSLFLFCLELWQIFDPPVSVYKGYSLPEDTDEYSCGLTNAIYTIAAADLKDDIFGKLMHCPFQVRVHLLPSAIHFPISISKRQTFHCVPFGIKLLIRLPMDQ